MEFANAFLDLDPGDVIHLSEPADRLGEPAADLTEHRRRCDRHTPVIMQERVDLPADLERRHIAAQVDAVQALDVQHRMTIQQLRDRDHMRHDDHPCSAGITVPSLNLPTPLSRQNKQPRRAEAEPRWEAVQDRPAQAALPWRRTGSALPFFTAVNTARPTAA